ncbi:MAG: glycosyltransferase family 4 protein [Candidatus Thermoplasmatota archaeon]
MNIAIVSSEYPPYHWGGVGSASYCLANYLAEKNNVFVLTRKHNMPMVKNHQNIKIYMQPWFKFPIYFALSFGKNCTKKLNELDIDITIVFGNMTLLPKKAYKKIKSPIITKFCGTWMGERSQLKLGDISPFSISGINDLAVKYFSPLFDIYEDYALLYSDGVIIESFSEIRAINERMKKRYGSENFLEKRENFFKLVPPPDLKIFSPDKKNIEIRRKFANDEEKIIIYVGRLTGRKGLTELIRIFHGYDEKYGDAKLILIGKGNVEPKLRRYCKKNGLEKKVYFLKELSFEEIATHYANADLFLFSSKWEGFGLVLLEAMASGLPCVSTPVGGAVEIINEKNGIIYKNEKEAVEGIRKCFDLDRRKIEKEIKEEFSPRNIADKIEEICRDVITKGKVYSKL